MPIIEEGVPLLKIQGGAVRTPYLGNYFKTATFEPFCSYLFMGAVWEKTSFTKVVAGVLFYGKIGGGALRTPYFPLKLDIPHLSPLESGVSCCQRGSRLCFPASGVSQWLVAGERGRGEWFQM